jgi:hypothetical protein
MRRRLLRSTRLLPASLQAPVLWFLRTEKICFDIVTPLRWPEGGAVCVHCGSRHNCYIATRGYWKCVSCRKSFSVRMGTILENSRLPLRIWLGALWVILASTEPLTVEVLSAALGITPISNRRMLHLLNAGFCDRGATPQWDFPFFEHSFDVSRSEQRRRERCVRWIDEISDLFGRSQTEKFFRSLRFLLACRP